MNAVSREVLEMYHCKDKSLRAFGCMSVIGLMFVAVPVNAGLMNLISSAATPLNFTSEWEWLFDNGTWATTPETRQFGAPDWEGRCKALLVET